MSANGFLTAAELTAIGNGLQLANAPAVGWSRVRAAAAAQGVNIHATAIASAYRPWAMQLDMRANPAKYGINPNLGGLPGLPSRHGLGNCRDVPFGAPNNWMITHGPSWGWVRPAATMAINDLNHWEYVGSSTAGGGTPVTPDAPPPPPPIGDIDMEIYEDGSAAGGVLTGQFYAGAPGKWLRLNNADFGGDAHVRDLLTAVNAKPIISLNTTDIGRVGTLWTAMAPPAGSGGGSAPADYFSDSDAAALQQNILNAVTVGDANILQAVSQLPAATLAAAGLQRIPQ